MELSYFEVPINESSFIGNYQEDFYNL